MPQSFITRCPECSSHFNINQEQLKAAAGKVRCGSCQHIFVATDHLESVAPEKAALVEDAMPREPLLLTPRSRSSGLVAFGWSLLISTAILGLVAQVLWFERDQLAHRPQLQPLYSEVCRHIDCRLPPRQDLPSIQSQQLLVRQHPNYANALTLDLTLVNRAPFDQPFPALQLSFTGLDNSLRAARAIQPHEYLGGDLQPGDLMPSRSPVQVHLELLDPGTLAPNYQLQFVQAKSR